MTTIPAIGDNVSEEEFLEECRQHYRKKLDDTEFLVRQNLKQIAKKHHPDNPQTEYQLRTAISRLLRTRFNLSRLNFVHCCDKRELLTFLDDLDKLLEGKT